LPEVQTLVENVEKTYITIYLLTWSDIDHHHTYIYIHLYVKVKSAKCGNIKKRRKKRKKHTKQIWVQ